VRRRQRLISALCLGGLACAVGMLVATFLGAYGVATGLAFAVISCAVAVRAATSDRGPL
jgi:hypothetical protein